MSMRSPITTCCLITTYSRIVTGLPSVAGAVGMQASGPSDLTVAADGTMDVTIQGVDMATPRSFGTAGAPLQHLVHVGADRTPRIGADLYNYEKVNNPDRREINSDPYALVAQGTREIVADAAANDLLAVDVTGSAGTDGVSRRRTAVPTLPALRCRLWAAATVTRSVYPYMPLALGATPRIVAIGGIRMKQFAIAFTVIVGLALPTAGVALANNPPGTGQPSQSCQATNPPAFPGNTGNSPGSAFNGSAGNVYANPTSQGGISSGNSHVAAQYDVACFQQTQH